MWGWARPGEYIRISAALWTTLSHWHLYRAGFYDCVHPTSIYIASQKKKKTLMQHRMLESTSMKWPDDSTRGVAIIHDQLQTGSQYLVTLTDLLSGKVFTCADNNIIFLKGKYKINKQN